MKARNVPTYDARMGHLIVKSGSFVATTDIYRLTEQPEREITLVYGDTVPRFQKRKVN